MKRAEVITFARTLRGVPFRHQGRNPNLGIDCVGFLVSLLDFAGVPHPQDRLDYPITGHSQYLVDRLAGSLIRVPIFTALPADVFLIARRPGGAPIHIALLTDYGIMHTSDAARKVAEHLLDESWLSRLDSAWKIPGLD